MSRLRFPGRAGFAGCAALALLALFLTACRPKGEAPVARIAGEAVTRAELEAYLESFPGRGTAALSPDPVARSVRADRLAEYIERRVFLREAARQGIEVSEPDVAARIEAFFPGASDQAARDLEGILAAQGVSPEAWKRRVREDMAIERLVARMVPLAGEIGEGDLVAHYNAHPEAFRIPERYTIRQIVVADAALAERLSRRLGEGASFEDLARTHSIGPEAPSGGLIGTFARGELPPAFEEAVKGLRPGRVSGVVKTEFGHHIFRLESRGTERMPRFAEVRPKVREAVAAERREAAFRNWKKKLLESARVEILDPSFHP